jgi:hypothetical protein
VARPTYFRVLAVLAAMVASALVSVMATHAPTLAATPSDTLKQPPFEPTDISLFDTVEYPDGPAMVPASSGPNDEATLGGLLLRDLLNERFGAGSTKVKQASWTHGP